MRIDELEGKALKRALKSEYDENGDFIGYEIRE